MYRRSLIGSLAACAVGATLAGCQQPAQKMQGMQDMKPPPRAAEMAHLDKWIGTWNWSGECKMAGADKTMAGSGRNTVTAVCDGHYIMEQMEGELGEMGKFSGIGMYTWDAKKKKYHTFWFDSHGSMGEGWMTYHPATRTWTMSGENENPAMGMTTVGSGEIKMADDNTMEWKWSESQKTLFGKDKMMDMTGTSRRG